MTRLTWLFAVVLAVPSLAQRGGPIRPITNLASQCTTGVADGVNCSGYERTWCVSYQTDPPLEYACSPTTHLWEGVGSAGSASTGEAIHALTADALSANGANCVAGAAPLGVNASGAVEGCTAYQTLDSDLTGYAALNFCSNGQIAKSNGTAWACSADSTGGTPSFDTVASGTNSTAAMILGTGSSLTTSGSGTNTANALACTTCVDMATELGTFSSADIAGRATNETGTGLMVFATSPALTTPTVTTAAADTNSTQAASTAYVQTELTAYASDTVTMTNKTVDAEGTGNVITIPTKVWLPGAGCQSTTALSLWDNLTVNPAVAACVSGTNTQKGVLDFDATTNQFAQITIMLPADWIGTSDAKFVWLAAATTGNVIWGIQTICVADAETDDPAFNTASTVTDTVKGTTLQVNTASITGVTTTGCAAGELMHINIYRDAASGSDTMSGNARLIGVEMTFRRAL